MSNYDPSAKVLWNSVGATVGVISATGNSGATLIDLRRTLDVALAVTVGSPAGSSPTLVVGLDIQDPFGNWIAQVIKTGTINAAGTSIVYGGLHAGSTMIVLPELGRISWTVGGTGGPSFPGVQIALIGR